MIRRNFLSAAAGLGLLAAQPAFGFQPAPTPVAARVPKVLIIGIDGVRPDALLAAKAPNLKALAEGGAYSYLAQTEDLTGSGPAWSSMLTGVHREKHGVHNNAFDGEDYSKFPHLFRRLKETKGKLRTASIVTWEPINYWIVSHCDYSQTCRNDVANAAAAAAFLRDQNPDILFLHFSDVDYAGHAKGYSPTIPAYVKAIEEADAYVGTVMTALKARPTYAKEDWLVLISTDHGGKGTNHGANIPECRTIFLIASGDAVKKGEIMPAPSIVDITAMSFVHLGVTIKPEWGIDGRPVGLATKVK
ncbi:MAG: alkaline phosphatase family protein [Cytophagales bacterium]|nr:alkaline phosphatase family protein [Armatimonadota bacterium]